MSQVLKKAAKLLWYEEGFKSEVYRCTAGYPTIAIGLKIGPKNAPLHCYEFTVSETAAIVMLTDKLTVIHNQLEGIEWYNALNDDRKCIVISMCYQLGISGFFKFKNTINFLLHGKYANAGIEMQDSKWAKEDTPGRANRHKLVMISGCLDEVKAYR